MYHNIFLASIGYCAQLFKTWKYSYETDNSDTGDISLGDFGLGKIIGPGETFTEPFGTFSYVALEVLQEKPYNFKVDLFAIGIITYLLVSGFLPFDHEITEKETARQTI